MLIAVCGARGFVGRHVVRRLRAAGHEVRCGTRRPEEAHGAEPGWDWVALDVDRPDTLDRAFAGADAVIYLVHQMKAGGGDLEATESASALRVREAAERAGVRRLVYLGGPAPSGSHHSAHLDARLATGEVLRSGTVSAIELRASMIVGAGSESWLIVRDLAFRLPVMVLPSWLSTRSEPIAIADVVAAIERALELPGTDSHWYDLPGPEVLSARQILERVAATVGMRPIMIPVPVLTPSLSSHWIRWVTRADYTVARKLVEGLRTDLVCEGAGFWEVAPDLERTPFDEAVRQALEAEDHQAMGTRARWFEGAVRRVAGGAG